MREFLSRMLELKNGDSVSAFARKAEIPQPSMDKYLKGRVPSIEVLKQIACRFGVSADWLLGLADDRAGRRCVGDSGDSGILLSKIHDLEIEVATLKNALSIVGGRPALAVKSGGSIATKIA